MLDRPSAWVVRNRPPSTPLFGLCAFESTFSTDRQFDQTTFEVRFGTARAELPLRSVISPLSPREWQVLFHVNTHLLTNGPLALHARLKWPDGFAIEWVSSAYEIENTGTLALEVARDLIEHGTPAIIGRTVDSALYPYQYGKARAWFNELEVGSEVSLSFRPAADPESARRHLAVWGFCVLDATLPSDLIREFNLEIDAAVLDGRLVHKEGSSDRVYGAHRLPHGRQVWLFPPVIQFLRDWFRDEPAACQSLLYINGSEQNAHQDTIHLTPYPAGYMCGVWVALEDVQNDSGELFVYPGSQRTERLMSSELNLEKVSTDYSTYVAFDERIRELLKEGGYEAGVYRPRAGEILIWHENLIHGGSRRLNTTITRRSIVSHYFTQGGIAYYDSRGEAAVLECVA